MYLSLAQLDTALLVGYILLRRESQEMLWQQNLLVNTFIVALVKCVAFVYQVCYFCVPVVGMFV